MIFYVQILLVEWVMQCHTQGLAPKTENHYVCLPSGREFYQKAFSISKAKRYGRIEVCYVKYARISQSALQEPEACVAATVEIISKS